MNFRRLILAVAVLGVTRIYSSPTSARTTADELVFTAGGLFLPGCELKVKIVNDSTAIYTPSSESNVEFRGPWPVRVPNLTLYAVEHLAGGDIDETLDLGFNAGFMPTHYRFSNMRLRRLSPLQGPKDCTGLSL